MAGAKLSQRKEWLVTGSGPCCAWACGVCIPCVVCALTSLPERSEGGRQTGMVLIIRSGGLSHYPWHTIIWKV